MGPESTVLVLGASGFLGSNVALMAAESHRVIAHSSRHPVRHPAVDTAVFDADDADALQTTLDARNVDVVINCVALASLEMCESDPESARRLNAEFPGTLAATCRRSGCRLVHVSTDAVFGGGPGPYRVDDPPRPVGQYGTTKMEGERRVLDADERALVVRTNVIGWSPSRRRSLLEHFVDNLRQGHEVQGFDDVYFRPVSAQTFWRLTEGWLIDGVGRGGGLRHATGAERISKFGFARKVAAVFELDQTLIARVSVAESHLTAPRTLDLDVLPTDDRPSGRARASIDADLLELRALDEAGWREALGLFLPESPGGPR